MSLAVNRAHLGRHMPKWIEADGMAHVRRVEIEHIAGAVARDAVDDLFRQIAMRVDQGNAAPRQNVLQDAGLEESCLPRTRLPDDINVAAAVFLRQRQKLPVHRRRPLAEIEVVALSAHMPRPAQSSYG